MTKMRALIGGCAVMALGAATGCEEMPPAEAPVGVVAEAGPAYPGAPTYAQSASGQWVWTDQYGWMWVPAEAMPLQVRGEPYVYLYTPTLGWTWFDSPWGWYGPAGGWGWARPYYGNYWGWGPRYHVYAPRAYNVAPPAYRVAPGGYNVAPPAYRAGSRGYNVAPPAYRVAPRATNVAPPAYHVAPRTFAAPHVFVHPGGGFHGGRR